jgi:hypothetical protein
MKRAEGGIDRLAGEFRHQVLAHLIVELAPFADVSAMPIPVSRRQC